MRTIRNLINGVWRKKVKLILGFLIFYAVVVQVGYQSFWTERFPFLGLPLGVHWYHYWILTTLPWYFTCLVMVGIYSWWYYSRRRKLALVFAFLAWIVLLFFTKPILSSSMPVPPG